MHIVFVGFGPRPWTLEDRTMDTRWIVSLKGKRCVKTGLPAGNFQNQNNSQKSGLLVKNQNIFLKTFID